MYIRQFLVMFKRLMADFVHYPQMFYICVCVFNTGEIFAVQFIINLI